jgi:hypothetical protein
MVLIKTKGAAHRPYSHAEKKKEQTEAPLLVRPKDIPVTPRWLHEPEACLPRQRQVAHGDQSRGAY